MFDMYWFLDSVQTKDLVVNENYVANKEDYYVIGGVGGDLANIIEAYESLDIRTSPGRKLIKNPQWVSSANTVINDLIDSGKIFVFGTIFNQSKIPRPYQLQPDLFKSSDNPHEVGIIGMWGRSYAQTVWIFMENILKNNIDVNPIVCLDREDPVILQSVDFHIKTQLAKLRPDAQVKVQSRDQARDNEKLGHYVSDPVCSILGNYVKFPDKYRIFEDLIKKTIKFKTKLIQVPGTNLGKFETSRVTMDFRSRNPTLGAKWTLGAKPFRVEMTLKTNLIEKEWK